MSRVLLTGANGFIGRHCLRPLLAGGHEIHALRHHSGQIERVSGVEWHTCDLLDSAAIDRLVNDVEPTHLMHLAWYVTPGKYSNARENLSWLRSSVDLLEKFVHIGGQRAVIAGTCAEYDQNYDFLCEGITPLRPSSLYAACKNNLREAVDKLASSIGLSCAWARVFYLYGPHEASGRLVPSVTLSLLQGERARCSSGAQIRDYLHVEDVARAFVALLDGDLIGPVNIGSGEPVIVRDMVRAIAACIGAEDKVDFGAMRESADDPPRLVANNCRLLQTGWTQRWTLEKGLADTVRWWQQQIGQVQK